MQKQPPVAGGAWPSLPDLPALEQSHKNAPLVLAGSRAAAIASAHDGLQAAVVHPRCVCFDMQTGPASGITRTPASLFRDIRIGEVDISENISVAPHDPLVVCCWRASAAVDVRFAWLVPAAASAVTHAENAVLRIEHPAGSSQLFGFSEPVRWNTEPVRQDILRVTAELRLPSDREVWLAISSGDAEHLPAMYQRIHEPSRVPVARAAAFRRRARDLFRIATPDNTLADAITRTIDRVLTSPVELPGGILPSPATPTPRQPARIDTVEACTIANAAAAIGDSTVPRATLRFLQHASADGLVPAGFSIDGQCDGPSHHATAAWIELAARYHAWSADDAILRDLWPDLRIAARLLDPAQFSSILRTLAATAESVGDDDAASELRRVAAPGPQDQPPRTRPTGDNTRAAERLLRIVHQTFGFDPDAARGRLRARLAIPGRCPSVRVTNVRHGDARVNIDVDQQPHCSRITAEQTAGAIPIRLILEPLLRQVPTSIEIDGRPAHLDLQPLRNRIVAPVQIELDHARTIEFRFQA